MNSFYKKAKFVGLFSSASITLMLLTRCHTLSFPPEKNQVQGITKQLTKEESELPILEILRSKKQQ
ncbi:hypothetical protein H0X06_02860 [Candidatus Dependentiae bacterium]|nr:hypothetical protein [Candidatus Dependentiae bacterium]